MKKNKLYDIKKYIESEGFKLKSTVYKNAKSKLELECEQHGQFYMNWNNFKTGQRCNKCRKEAKLVSDDIIENTTIQLGYEYISHFREKGRIYVNVICQNDHKETVRFDSIQRGQFCFLCDVEKKRYSIIELKKIILDIFGDELSILSTSYDNKKQKLEFSCKEHGIFKKELQYILRGYGCPSCSDPFKRETECRKIIEKLSGKKFPKVKPSWLIAYDSSYLLELDGYCKKLNLAFEYDGEQHFYPISFMGGNRAFRRRLILDKMKDEICLKENVSLIRIPYYEKDLENYIKKELLKLNIDILED